MKHEAMVRKLRLLMVAGAVVLALGVSTKHAGNAHEAQTQPVVISSDTLKGAVLIADGSESTGGGKPTKPNHS